MCFINIIIIIVTIIIVTISIVIIICYSVFNVFFMWCQLEDISDFKRGRGRRQWKRRQKNKFAFFQT